MTNSALTRESERKFQRTLGRVDRPIVRSEGVLKRREQFLSAFRERGPMTATQMAAVKVWRLSRGQIAKTLEDMHTDGILVREYDQAGKTKASWMYRPTDESLTLPDKDTDSTPLAYPEN